MDEVLGYRKLQQLHDAIEQFSVPKNDVKVSSGWFNLMPSRFEPDIPGGFQIYCSEGEPPWELRVELYRTEKRNFTPLYKIYDLYRAESDVKSGYFIVAHCRWLWSKDKQDILGVRVRTDVTANLVTSYHGDTKNLEQVNQKRYSWQNLPKDIEWAKEKINWLWKYALPTDSLPMIVLDEKLELHEYIDHGDYL